jgi:hypothetical protein
MSEMRHFADFIEFTQGGRKKIISLDSIESVEASENGKALVNGEEVDQGYEDILNFLNDYACVNIDHDLIKES